MKFKAIIFDFDGTIADTKKSIIQTVKETLEYLGYTLKNDELVEKLIGLPLKRTFIETAGLKGTQLERAIKIYRTKYRENAFNLVNIYPGVEFSLNKLYNIGFKLAIASNRGRNMLNKMVLNFGIKNLFSSIAGEEDTDNKKPAPDVVNLILTQLKTQHRKTLVVGDTIYDIEMAKRANCYSCAVTYGNGKLNDLKAINPDYLINNFSEILDIVIS